MPKPDRQKQTHLADPALSYKSVRFHGPLSTPQFSSIADQSTLSQFGFTPSSTSSTRSEKPKKKRLIPYGKRGLKRKSLDFDDLKDESSEAEEEEGSPSGKRMKVRVTRKTLDDDDEPIIKREPGREEDGNEESDEDDWRPSYAPKRQRGKFLQKGRKSVSSSKRNNTLTQMYPFKYPVSGSDNNEDDEEWGEEEVACGGANYSRENEMVKVKEEPNSQDSLPCGTLSGERSDEEEREQPFGNKIKTEPIEKENLILENVVDPASRPSSTSENALDPQTPKKPMPNIVPSSYTPPITPLSPLRHSQLDAIYKSPSVQRLWRMKGLELSDKKKPGGILVPIGEGAESSDVIALGTDSEDSSSADADTRSPNARSGAKPDFISNKMVPSSQWWERDETWSSMVGTALDTIHEASSQSEIQVQSSDVPATRSANVTPTAQRISKLEDIDVVPESPLKKRGEEASAKQVSPVAEVRREPLLRDSSGLRSNSSLGKESSSLDRIPNSVPDEESQRSEVSTRSVDRQLLFESNDYRKMAHRDGRFAQEEGEKDSDETLSQTPLSDNNDPERTPMPSRTKSLDDKAESYKPLLPQSSPPLKLHGQKITLPSTPESSKDVFHSPSSTLSTSPIPLLQETFSSTSKPSSGVYDDLNETIGPPATYRRNAAGETHTQWKLRMFGPSQAVPTISQILPESLLADDDDDDEEEEL